MKIKIPLRWPGLCAAMLLASTRFLAAQNFYGLGVIPGGGQNDALLISADGCVVAGKDGRLGEHPFCGTRLARSSRSAFCPVLPKQD
jgi:hypothetical protein